MITYEINNEVDEIRKWEEKIKRKDSKYITKNFLHAFQQFETIRYSDVSIYTGKINIVEAEMDQSIY